MSLTIKEEEILGEKVKEYPALYDKTAKGYKEKDVVENAWRKVAESLDFAENGRLLELLFNLCSMLY